MINKFKRISFSEKNFRTKFCSKFSSDDKNWQFETSTLINLTLSDELQVALTLKIRSFANVKVALCHKSQKSVRGC